MDQHQQAGNHAATAIMTIGNALAWVADHNSELQSLALLLTICYGIWQFIRDFRADSRASGLNRALLSKLQRMRTEAIPLDEDSGHDNGRDRQR